MGSFIPASLTSSRRLTNQLNDMAAALQNNRDKFSKQTGRTAIQAPPPFPRLPKQFIERYPPEIQELLEKYSDACDQWVKKYVQSLS
jgi:hypothetical protein